MADTRAIEHAPLLGGNRTLVTDCECRDHARVRPAFERGQDAFPDRFAQANDVVARPSGKRREPPVGVALADVTGRAELVFEKPGLDIEAVRIDRTVRALEAHGEIPTLASAQLRNIFARALASPRPVPPERQPRRDDGSRSQHLLHRKRESFAALLGLRQLVDHADDLDVASFPDAGQLVGEPRFRAPRGIKESAEPNGSGGR